MKCHSIAENALNISMLRRLFYLFIFEADYKCLNIYFCLKSFKSIIAMKNISKYTVVLFFVFIALFTGCDLTRENVPEDNYIVEFVKHKTYTVDDIKGRLNLYAIIYPELKVIVDNLKHGVQVYKITYKTKFKGKEIIASGLVSVPLTSGSYPILSYQNGTNTLHSNAPSVNPDYELYQLLEFVASTGFIVSVPDYLGFGSSDNMFHPYYDKKSTNESTTDMLWAVKELANNYLEVVPKSDLFVMGYSQGGWATMQLQKYIEENYSSEFKLRASACGAGGYDVRYINDYILAQTEYPMPYYIGYMINSYVNLGEVTNPPSDIFKSPYSERILTLYNGTKSGDEINAQLTTKIADLFTTEYRTTVNTNTKYLSVINSLTKNSISAWKTNVPTMILHGTADTYVPYQGSVNIYNDFLAKGVPASTVTLVPISGAGHNSAIIPAGVASINWFIELNKKN
jgi:pimeloyl-ACP methyl ester carboxylesterase